MATITTFHDAVNHLVDFKYGAAQDVEQRVFKRACRAAYRDLIDSRRWRYFNKEYSFASDVAQDSSTITYDHTGGTNEREVTIAAGTWPTWAAQGRLKVAGNIYEVDRRVSDTVLTLPENTNPGADVAALTDYTLYRSGYQLPDDFRQIVMLHDDDGLWYNSYISPDQWATQERYYNRTERPFWWTLLRDPDNDGRWIIQMPGYPSASKELMFIYHAAGRDIVRSGVETSSSVGTITTNATTAITGANTTFTTGPSMVGSYLRVGDATDIPTGEDGLAPFAEQHKILSVESATALTLATATTTSTASLKYVVSDQVEMAQDMTNAFLRGCEFQLALMTEDSKRIGNSHGQYVRALLLAMEADDRVAHSISATGTSFPYSMADERGISFGSSFAGP